VVKQFSFGRYSLFLLLVGIIVLGVLGSSAGPALASESQQQIQTINFSRDSAITNQPFSLSLSSPLAGTIRYSTNGGVPKRKQRAVHARPFPSTNQPWCELLGFWGG